MPNEIAKRPIDSLKMTLNADSVKEQFQNALKESAPLFAASIIDLFGSDPSLQKCSPGSVVSEALKAAVLRLPINKNLGFAYIIPYNESKKTDKGWEKVMTPHFQLGYKGIVQLALRSGVYRSINAGIIYKGEVVEKNRLSGDIEISGEQESSEAIGFFAYIETLNGFSKAKYRTVKEAQDHAKKYSATYRNKAKIWKEEEDKMHVKGVLKDLLSKYGSLSVEMASAMSSDISGDSTFDNQPPVISQLDEALGEQKTNPDSYKKEPESITCPNSGDTALPEDCKNCKASNGCPVHNTTSTQKAGLKMEGF